MVLTQEPPNCTKFCHFVAISLISMPHIILFQFLMLFGNGPKITVRAPLWFILFSPALGSSFISQPPRLHEKFREFGGKLASTFFSNHIILTKLSKIVSNSKKSRKISLTHFDFRPNGCSGILRLNNRTIFLKIQPITSYGLDLFSFIQVRTTLD